MSFVDGDKARANVLVELAGVTLGMNTYTAVLWKGTGGELTDEQAIADWRDYLEAVYADMLKWMSQAVVFRGFRLYKRVGTLWNFVGEENLTLDGTAISEVLPTAASALLVGTTNKSRKMGKKYVPFFGEAASIDLYWAVATVADMAASCLIMITPFASAIPGDSWRPGILSIATNAFEFYTGGFVSAIPAYQRRRKPGRGA